jgi:hypothetical protein
MGYIGSRSSKTFMTNDLVEGRDHTLSDVLRSICVGFSVNCMRIKIGYLPVRVVKHRTRADRDK